MKGNLWSKPRWKVIIIMRHKTISPVVSAGVHSCSPVAPQRSDFEGVVVTDVAKTRFGPTAQQKRLRYKLAKQIIEKLTQLIVQVSDAVDWRIIGAWTEIFFKFIKRLAEWVVLLSPANLAHRSVRVVIIVGDAEGFILRKTCVIWLNCRHSLVVMLLNENACWSFWENVTPSAAIWR